MQRSNDHVGRKKMRMDVKDGVRRRGSGGRKALLRTCKGVCNRPSSSHGERDKGGFFSTLFLSSDERGYKGVHLHPSSSPLW
jgi:hypothetical protein